MQNKQQNKQSKSMKEHAKFAGKVLVSLIVIGLVAGALGLTAWIQNPWGQITGKTGTPSGS